MLIFSFPFVIFPLLPCSFCFSLLPTSVYLTFSLHLLLLSPGATLEFQIFSSYVCVFFCVSVCRCVCVCAPVAVCPHSQALMLLQAMWGVRVVCVCWSHGDPWYSCYLADYVQQWWGVTRFNRIVCVSVCMCLNVYVCACALRLTGWLVTWRGLTSCTLIQSLPLC